MTINSVSKPQFSPVPSDGAIESRINSELSLEEIAVDLFQALEEPLLENNFDRDRIFIINAQLANSIFELYQAPLEGNFRWRKMTPKEATFNLECMLGEQSDIEELQIHLYFPKNVPGADIATGGWKKVKNSLYLSLPKGDLKSIKASSSVLQRSRKDVTKAQLKQLLLGIAFQTALNEKLDPEHQLAANPSMIYYETKTGKQRFEFQQEWYSGNFTQIQKGLPLTRQKNSELIFITESKKYELLITLNETINFAHEFGVVHGDIKGSNILIEIDKTLKVRPRLSDFDYSKFLGFRPLDSNESYIYWDIARHNGFLLPSCDIHGLVVTLANDLFPLKIENKDQSWSDKFECDEHFRGNLLRQFALIELALNLPNSSLRGELMFNDIQTPQMTLDTILKLYHNYAESSLCTEDEREILEALEIELIILEKVIQLLANQFKLGKQLWEKMKDDPTILDLFESENTEAKRNGYNSLISTIPHYLTMDDITRELLEIKTLRDKQKMRPAV